MSIGKFLIAGGAATSAALLWVSGVQAQEEALPEGPRCTVTLERTQPDDVYDVTRQVFEDGTCNCFVYTGAASQSQSVESRVTRILEERRCPKGKPMLVTRGAGQVLPASYPASEAVVVAVPATALFAAGVIIALDGPDSP